MSIGVADVRLSGKVNQINRDHFENRRVLTCDSNGVQVHINRIGGFENVVYTNQPGYVVNYVPGPGPAPGPMPYAPYPAQAPNYPPQGPTYAQPTNPGYYPPEPSYAQHATAVASNPNTASGAVPYAEATVIQEEIAPGPDGITRPAKG